MMENLDNHPLIGTWITEDEDSDTAVVIEVVDNDFVVSAFCRSDAEYFEITNTQWDSKSLSFDALMPSTKTRSKNKFTVIGDDRVEMELTLFEMWKKKDVKPGDMPEAWITNEESQQLRDRSAL